MLKLVSIVIAMYAVFGEGVDAGVVEFQTNELLEDSIDELDDVQTLRDDLVASTTLDSYLLFVTYLYNLFDR